MKINSYSPSFGIKIPVNVAIESATGCFFEDAKISNPRQNKLLEDLSGLDVNKMYTGQLVDGLRGVRNVIRERFPEIAHSADRIKILCDLLNENRMFDAKGETLIRRIISTFLYYEVKNLKIKEIELEKLSLKELGLDKYENL